MRTREASVAISLVVVCGDEKVRKFLSLGCFKVFIGERLLAVVAFSVRFFVGLFISPCPVLVSGEAEEFTEPTHGAYVWRGDCVSMHLFTTPEILCGAVFYNT